MSESEAEAMSERELEEIEKWDQQRKSLYGTSVNPVNLQNLLLHQVGPLVSEVRRSHDEAAELRKQVEQLKNHLDNYAEVIGNRQAETAELRQENQSLETINQDLRRSEKRVLAQMEEAAMKHRAEYRQAEEQSVAYMSENTELRERVPQLERALKCVADIPIHNLPAHIGIAIWEARRALSFAPKQEEERPMKCFKDYPNCNCENEYYGFSPKQGQGR